jgi:hypothetical protein
MISTKINSHIEIIELWRRIVYYYNRKVGGREKKGKSRMRNEKDNTSKLYGYIGVM